MFAGLITTATSIRRACRVERMRSIRDGKSICRVACRLVIGTPVPTMSRTRGGKTASPGAATGLSLDLDGPELEPVFRRVDEALDPRRKRERGTVERDRDEGGVLHHDYLVRLLVERLAGLIVVLRRRLVEQRIDLRVAVVARIGAIRRLELRVGDQLDPVVGAHAPAELETAVLRREA